MKGKVTRECICLAQRYKLYDGFLFLFFLLIRLFVFWSF